LSNTNLVLGGAKYSTGGGLLLEHFLLVGVRVSNLD
jgi:hypothetical protein